MLKKILPLLIITTLITGCFPAVNLPVEPDNNVACTADAKQCPDGSFVGRVAPDCKFAPCPALQWITIESDNIPGLAGSYDFSASIPDSWKVEAVPAIEAINIYDPLAIGDSNLEKSQIFIRYFNASQFLTLDTVTIFNTTQTETNNRPTVIYDIEKKSGVPNFTNQPLWRSQRHLVTDIRSTDDSPTTFYVFGQRPDLDNQVFQQFLNSLQFNPDNNQSLNVPVDDFFDGITKKEFGTFVTPENSPVSPERFSGYHTGVDVEYENDGEDVLVYAITDGTVIHSSWNNGYGGVVAIRHNISDKDYVVIYGHLDPDSLPAVGQKVSAGEKIGILGDGFTSETDGERKHLHFAVIRGSQLDLRGYVQSQDQLQNWIDPILLYR